MVIFLLLVAAVMELISASGGAPPVPWSERGFITPEELGVVHVPLPGTIPTNIEWEDIKAKNGGGETAGVEEFVILHAFMSRVARASGADSGSGQSETVVRGFFFVEPVSTPKITGWGALKQPLPLTKPWG